MSRNWQSKNRTMGLCYSCSDKPVNGTSSWCEKHWLTQAAWRFGLRGRGSWKKLKDLLEAQNYTCPYSGRKLIIGMNASVDHKLPRSKYPGLVGSIGNCEWVDEDVNRAKRAMTPAEFIALCKSVADRFQ
jgi:5-methylcytosine-specific restriction endonuclease McrA